jgi:predicted transcriptional regulator
MYKTNLSWKPLMKILESMIEQELIIQKNVHKRTIYGVTMKGKNVLNYFAKVMQLIELR